MRRVALGRVFPRGFSTDRRLGRLSLKAVALLPLLWCNADDQGRFSGEPEDLKYTCCPNIDHITKADIADILKEFEQNKLIQIYQTPKSAAIQILDWWEIHRPQWAYPSEYPPMEGWADRLRYHPEPGQVITENWVTPSQWSRELPSALRSTESERAPSTASTGEDLLKDIIVWGPPITRDTKSRQGDHTFVLLSFKIMAPPGFDFNQSNLISLVTDVVRKASLADFPSFPFHKVIESRFGLITGSSFPNWVRLFSHVSSIAEMSQRCIVLESSKEPPEIEKGNMNSEIGKGEGEEEGNKRSTPGSVLRSTPSPPPLAFETLFEFMKRNFPQAWGREASSKECAYLRDLSSHISESIGGVEPSEVINAYKEAKFNEKQKMSYFGAVLCDHLGIARMRHYKREGVKR